MSPSRCVDILAGGATGLVRVPLSGRQVSFLALKVGWSGGACWCGWWGCAGWTRGHAMFEMPQGPLCARVIGAGPGLSVQWRGLGPQTWI